MSIGEHVPDPTRPSGYRWRRFDEPEPTRIQPAVEALHGDERYDHLAEQSFNGLRPEDELLPQPPQDPDWRPDANG